MKIAFLNKYQKKVYRGAETYVSELSKRLSVNHKVDVISDIDYWDIARRRYDVIIPTNGRMQAVLIRAISWFTGAKVVISGQSGPGLDDRLNLYTFPDVFVGLTGYQTKWAKKINPFVKIATIPNGVDIKKFYPSSSGSGKKGGCPVILSVGAFTSEKRHDLTIKAVAGLKDVSLTIVGGGGGLKQEIVDYGTKILGTGRFRVLSVPFDQMPEMYSQASVFAFPTVGWESFGIALLEAMASGLPVVATNDPIRREIVGEAGFLVNPEDTKEYSQSLRRALNTDWGNKPRKQAEKFSWDEIAERYEDLLLSLSKT
jgi:glycosyltransferase involved in cell wall biosynthesis